MILVYDWILCFDDEVRFVWKSDSGVTGTSLVYLLSRYMLLIQTFLAVVTAYPMSDLVRARSTAVNRFSEGPHRCACRGNLSSIWGAPLSAYAGSPITAVEHWGGLRPRLG